MLTQTAVREYRKKISEEYNSINLNIRTVCAVHKANILQAESLRAFITLNRVLKSEGLGGKEERVQQAQTGYIQKQK
jgi:hypothetical protein